MGNKFGLLLSLLIFSLLFNNCLFSQKINKLYVVKNSAKFSPGDIVSPDIRDVNGDVAAALIIETDLEGLSFEANNGVVKLIHNQPGEYKLLLQPSERVVYIYAKNYQPLRIILYNYDIMLKSGQAWRIKITGDKQLDKIPINVLTNIKGAKIFFDGKYEGNGKTFKIAAGKHKIRIEKEGYRTIEEEINVTEDNILFNYTLQSIDLVAVKITSEPQGSMVFINEEVKGKTPLGKFLYPGKYKIRLSLSGYLPISEEITVTENGNNEFNYTLVKNVGYLQITTIPADAKLLINKEDYSRRGNIEIAPGTYKIEVSKEGYYGKEEVITLELGKTETREYKLEAEKGDLQFSISPPNAKVVLKRDGNEVEKWKGLKLIKGLMIGKYEIEAKAKGYKTYKKEITIEENKRTVLEAQILRSDLKKLKTININALKIELIGVKGGTFEMGSNEGYNANEAPAHTVTVDDFYLGKYEVTYKEYIEFLNNENINSDGKNGKVKLINLNDDNCGISYSFWKFRFNGNVFSETDNTPVIDVTWYGAVAFCNWLSEQEGLEKFYNINGNKVTMNWGANGYRLPTEAEWEYAARGGNFSRGYKYSGSNNINDVAWYNENSGNKTHPVGTKHPNELGIYDMSGNVWEWCNDWYVGNYYSNSPQNSQNPVDNPRGPRQGIRHVYRGGSLGNFAFLCSITVRGGDTSESSSNFMGFRIVRMP